MFSEIEKDLILVEKPARYIGNEAGIPKKDFKNTNVRMVISYPDIYEIGMSNNGIKILYDIVNKIEYASCERVFSVWTDFEKYLREKKYDLYSLETKTPLHQFDIVGISIQYELLFSNFLNIIDLGGIPLRSENRTENDPIIIIGGPAVSNPVPYFPFVDLIVIGEGEEVIAAIISEFDLVKKLKKSRSEKIKHLSEIPGVLSPEYSKNKVIRQVFTNFENDKGVDIAIIPSIDIVQNKLVVEIMRGCPNKCRFCQAGVLYKPYREKNTKTIMDSIEKGLRLTGVNEVTFASLSSGDYSHIVELCDYFNDLYSKKGISVSLPSLKVESFDIDILDKISLIRKSGLTFAIESGSTEGQLSINKLVDIEKIYSIIEYAIKKGWRLVKFYFMVGLPDDNDDVTHIISFVDNVLQKFKGLTINLNVSTFVPKPHTPYELVKQLDYPESKEKLLYIKNYYKKTRVNVKYHPPEMSYIEGFIARGDEKVGYGIEAAFLQGARFDGWNDKFNFSLYVNEFEKKSINYDTYLTGSYTKKPWNMVDSLLNEEYLINEREKSKQHTLTSLCKDECEADCSICNREVLKKNSTNNYVLKTDSVEDHKTFDKGRYRYILEFTKKGLSKYISHKDLMRYFETLSRILGVDIMLSEGFNPHPRFQFSSAMSLGLESMCELLELYTTTLYPDEVLLTKFNSITNNDIVINRIRRCESTKKSSLYDNLYSSMYRIDCNKSDVTDSINCINVYNAASEFKLIEKEITFDLKQFVFFEVDSNNSIFLTINRINPGPKLINIVKSVLLNKEITIIKIKMIMQSHNELKDLFYLE